MTEQAIIDPMGPTVSSVKGTKLKRLSKSEKFKITLPMLTAIANVAAELPDPEFKQRFASLEIINRTLRRRTRRK